MKYFLALFILLSFFSCKKDEENNDNNTGNPTPAHYSTTIYTLDFTLQDIPYHFEFGENGYGFQFSSFIVQTEEEVFVTGITSFTWNGDPKTTNQGYVSVSLPTCIVPMEDWQANSALAFLNYLAGDYPVSSAENADICSFSFADANGTSWNTFNTSQSESSANCFGYMHPIENESPSLGVNGGEATLNLYNIADDITETVELTWNMRFQEPM
jgi:hypothetical protein